MEEYMRRFGDFSSGNPRGSDFDNTPLKDLPLTMAYVPMQTLGDVYEPEDALCAGTLFPALDKPVLGRRWDQ